MMGLTSHLSFVYYAFSSYCVSFSLMTSLTMMGLGLGHLVPSLFHFPLENPLVMSVSQVGKLVESQKYFPTQKLL